MTHPYTFLGTTRSLCPHCRRVVDAKIIARRGRVYFRKRCPEHGEVEDFVCSDVAYYDRNEFSQPARLPKVFGTLPDKGCPLDCGLCTEHEQHACIALVEITSGCNLKCPMCFAESGPGGRHVDFESFCRMVDRFVFTEVGPLSQPSPPRGEGKMADVLQISGGEPTLHPELVRMAEYACRQPIAAVMINTNGIRLAKDPELVRRLAELRHKLEIYLQFDGFDDGIYQKLRGEELLATKLECLDVLERHDLRCTLVCTVDHNINLHEVGKVVEFGLKRPVVRGVTFQLATYCGRHTDPGDLERRVTMPDVVKAIAAQTGGLVAEADFTPLPCAHPNCHMLAYLYRGGAQPVSISRLIDVKGNLDLIANSIVYTPQRVRQLVSTYLERAAGGCCGPEGCAPSDSFSRDPQRSANAPLDEFLVRALAEQLTGKDVFRILLIAFLDAHNFDVRRVMKCCITHVLPSGHVVPFCAYNTLYRDGFVPLPPLADQVKTRRSLQVVG